MFCKGISRVCTLLTAAMLMASTAFAAEGVVDTSSLILRKSTSTASKALHTLRTGDKMDILSVEGEWYRVRFGKYKGYVMAKYVEVKGKLPESSSSSSSAAPSSSYKTLRPGDRNSSVKTLQSALKAQGFYDGKIDGVYGNGTLEAVKKFQKKNSLKQDGIAGPQTLAKLYNDNVSTNQSVQTNVDKLEASVTLRPGYTGEAVREMQKKLKSLGFYSGSLDGEYGNGTMDAVKAFQKKNGLSQDGVAGPNTISKLLSASANSAAVKTESLEWFKNGDSAIPRNAVITIKDVKTGKTFKARRWAGTNHSDTEPLTASDTAIMKEIYGGSWSWERRAILVSYNGHVYAASMNGMPHGTTTISNGFSGHFCIHFTNSRTHGTDRVDPDHQNAVQKALNAAW